MDHPHMDWKTMTRRDLDEEIEQHLQDRYEELVESGMAPDAALRAVAGEVADLPSPRAPLLVGLGGDIRYALRTLRKNAGFAAIVVATLALGIGANTALFTIVNGVLLNPLPYPHSEELVVLHESKQNFPNGSISYPNFQDWRRANHTFTGMAISRPRSMALTGRGEAEQVTAQLVTADLFRILGVQPALGRTFLPGEDAIGAAPIAMVSEGLWRRKLDASPAAIGQTLTLDGRAYAIVGVVPSAFQLTLPSFRPSDLYVPVGQWSNDLLTSRAAGLGFHGLGRLKPGVSVDQARADMETVTRDLTAAYPDVNKGIGATVFPLKDAMVGSVRTSLIVLAGAVAFVLFIACANVANLVLARAVTRRREIAVRIALGASRARVVRQLVTESVLLAFAGGGGGLVLSAWSTRLALAALPAALPRTAEVAIDLRVLLFTAALSLGAGILFGVAPALRSASDDLNESLKEGGRGSSGARHRLQATFVVAETALAVVLLVGAGLLIRTLVRLWSTDPGFRTENVITFGVSLAPPMMRAPADAIRAAERQLHDRVASTPGVVAASISWAAFPMSGDDEHLFWKDGQPKPASPNDMSWALRYIVEPDYLSAMRIPLRRGRFFTAHDDERAPRVAVVDEEFAQKFFHDADPIGKRLNDESPGQVEIVGVVAHVNQWGLDRDDTQPLRAQLYLPFFQLPDPAIRLTPAGVGIVMRTDGTAPDVMGAIRRKTAALDPDQTMFSVQTLDEIVAGSLAPRRITMALLGAFALTALALASLGIYGVLAHKVGQQTHELGVRIALGARPVDVTTLVVGQGLRLALGGVALGVAGAVALTRLMATLLIGVSPIDPATFGGVAALLVLVALVACWIPARRATRVDPLLALRTE
jgi:putative ABC transport system permease protein